MRVIHAHHLSQATAIKRVDHFLDKLMRRPLPAGVKIKDAQKVWNGGEMSFALKLSKGFFSTRINGTIKVSGKTVMLNCAPPKLVTALVGEGKIKTAVKEQVDELFVTK